MDRAQCLQILMSVYFSIKIIHGQSTAANLLPGFKKVHPKFSRRHSSTTIEATCPVYPSQKNIHPFFKRSSCGKQFSSCSKDKDCEAGLKCCFDGCINICDLPNIRTIKVTSAPKKVMKDQIRENSLYIDGPRSRFNKKSCTKSNNPNIKTKKCPLGYICKTNSVEERSDDKVIKGLCKIDKQEGMIDAIWPKYTEPTKKWSGNSPCLYDGHEYPHNHHFVKNCRLCLCTNSVINCQISIPCAGADTLKRRKMFIRTNRVEVKSK